MMKRIQNTINQIKLLLIVSLFSLLSLGMFAQTGPPPPPDENPNSETAQNNKLGGNAHIGGGVIILLTLALAYGGKRLYDLNKENKKEKIA
jgi:hypothetical protein